MKNVSGIFKRTLIASGLGLLCIMAPMSAFAELAKSYDLTETDSQIIKFDNNLRRALIANPDLATVKVLSKNELLITGKSAGRTQLILTYRDTPNKDHTVVLNVAPDQSRREEINSTLVELLKELDPQGMVNFQLKNIWVAPNSSIRREVDNIGNQMDGDAAIASSNKQDKAVLQAEGHSGSANIQPLAGNYMVILSGEVRNKARKKRIQSVLSTLGLSVVNMIKVTGPQQIKLSVRVAEVVKGNPFRSGFAARDKKDQYGIFPPGNLGTTASFLLNVENVVAGSSREMSFPHPDGFQLGINPFGSDLFGVLSILEGNQLARVLAKPELVVQAGETAEFLVGGEIPVPASQGANGISVTFKTYGVILKFSPIITESGKIQMTVAPEISNVDEATGTQSGTIVVPGFRSRKASTTVTLASGQSFVIGGLIQDNFQSSVNKIPLLGDIPILGALFRSTSYEKDQSELAILVTPSFVQPISKDTKVTLPGENIQRPSAAQGFFMGKLAELLPEGQSALPESSVKYGLEKP